MSELTIALKSGLCRNCGAVATAAHHAVPKGRRSEGRYEILNILPLCGTCHAAWHDGVPIARRAFEPEEWAKVVELAPSTEWLDARYPEQATPF